ncbi:hypothetical protein VHEMI07009 [[Torrubiella] hemipterigena]|uniref:Uncharacterized protein n=1 Tax=[Torrubiella] hemipterigena TaxID=1531966 RepID=A0A0A1TM50_9HYPO|nr:hypothetical protein VHEMI07009 [[Torrubiella] hemipterigena]
MYDIEANRGPHPSESIPNAAYPESNYRPGGGSIPAPSSTFSNSQPSTGFGPQTTSFHTTSTTHTTSSQATWQHADDGSDPPPPYVPAAAAPQVPVPVPGQHLAQQSPTPTVLTPIHSRDERLPSAGGIPLSNLPPLATTSSAGQSGSQHPPFAGGHPGGHYQPNWPPAAPGQELNTPDGRHSSQSHKYDQVGMGMWQSRQRRAQRAKICGLSSGFVVAICIAIAVAIGISLRNSHSSNY